MARFTAHCCVTQEDTWTYDSVMTTPKPHYLLFCDGNFAANGETNALTQRGRWRFVLENVGTGEKTEATDCELTSQPERTALLAVLRGLEALEQPSRVTLVTTSRYVSRGLQYGLSEWRENDYSWEHFGAVQPIRNADLWKRIDRTLSFHQVQCRFMAQGDSVESETAVDSHGMGAAEPAFAESAVELEAYQPAETLVMQRKSRETTVGGERQGAAESRASNRSAKNRVGDRGRTRSTVAKSPTPRIYVDTPPKKSECDSSELSRSAAFEEYSVSTVDRIGSARRDSDTRRDNDSGLKIYCEKNSQSSPFSPITWLALLSRFLLRCFGRLWNGVWARILAVDEWLDLSLRCLLLLEPRVHRPRRS